jgi:hypothetical protein
MQRGIYQKELENPHKISAQRFSPEAFKGAASNVFIHIIEEASTQIQNSR